MAAKKRSAGRKKLKNPDFKEFGKHLERDIRREVRHAEKWVVERRKFFVKLGWLIALVIALLILSSLLIGISVGAK